MTDGVVVGVVVVVVALVGAGAAGGVAPLTFGVVVGVAGVLDTVVDDVVTVPVVEAGVIDGFGVEEVVVVDVVDEDVCEPLGVTLDGTDAGVEADGLVVPVFNGGTEFVDGEPADTFEVEEELLAAGETGAAEVGGRASGIDAA